MATTRHEVSALIKSLEPPPRLLYGPGPSMVPSRVYAAMGKPIVGHLDPYFFSVLTDVQALLKPVFGAEQATTFVISGTGSAGMEAAVTNFVEPGMKFVVFVNGFFCERIADMGARHGAEVVRFEKPWGDTFDDAEAAEFIQRHKPQLVAYVNAETSTGALQPGNAICRAAHNVGALVMADVVTSLGAMPINVDATSIDVAYSCSQKGLSCPPGLAPIAVSARGLEYLKNRKTPIQGWYFDLKLIHEYFTGSHRYHHTAPISLFYALHEALVMIGEEGTVERYERHHHAHKLFVEKIEAMGLQMHVAPGRRIWNLNTVRVPQGIDDAKVRRRLLDKFGIEILGGFGQLAGKVFRIGVMGPLANEESVDGFLEAFGECLRAEGFK
jgi:alanine-glyoxylate transaminase/serine-glyoxylate transaminase/serine-pyruvate transaminase